MIDFFYSFCMFDILLLFSHFTAMNLVQIGRTLSSLMSQVQEFIHDYNVTRAVNDNSASSSNRFSFPGLKTRGSSSSIQQPTPATLMEECAHRLGARWDPMRGSRAVADWLYQAARLGWVELRTDAVVATLTNHIPSDPSQ